MSDHSNHPMYRQIKGAQNLVPSYIFRTFHTHSGGYVDLNTDQSITPHAFLLGRGHQDIFDLNASQITTMGSAHFGGRRTPLSEFSSWAASFILNLAYAHYFSTFERRIGVRIGVLDTFSVDNTIGLARVFGGPHADVWEYLVHGVIQGSDTYRAVSLRAIRAAGLRSILPEIAFTNKWGQTMRAELFKRATNLKRPSGQPEGPAEPCTRLTEHEVITAKKIGELFGGQFVFPIMIALISIRARSWRYSPGDILDDELEIVMRHLSGVNIHPELRNQACVLGEVQIEVSGQPEVQQMYFLMRKIFQRRAEEEAKRAELEAKRLELLEIKDLHRMELRPLHGQKRGYDKAFS